MRKLGKKALGTVMAGVMTVGAVAGAINSTENVTIVNAAESKALQNAKAKISHLTWSLKNNYLGIKNQGTWELYVKQARELISKISSSEKKQADLLTEEVNRDEAMIQGLARINKVEKSIETNYNGIKNARQWREYLNLANEYLGKVDQKEFKKQYDELVTRMNKCAKIVEKIEADFDKDYKDAVILYYEASSSKDLKKAEAALKAAEALGTCDESDKLEQDCKNLINDIKGVSSTTVLLAEAVNGKELKVVFSKEVDETKVASAVKLMGKDGEVTFTLNQKSIDGKTFTLTANKLINIENGTITVEAVPTKADSTKLTDKYVAVFNFKDTVAPKVSSIDAKDKKAIFVFDEELSSGATVSVNGQNYSNITISGKTLTINSLENGNTYSVQVVGVKDSAGNMSNPITTTFTVKKTEEDLKQEVTAQVNENKLTLKFVNPISSENKANVLFVNGKNYYSKALVLNGETTSNSGIIYSSDKKTVIVDTQKIGVLGSLSFLNTDVKISGAGLEKDALMNVKLSSDTTGPKLISSETNASGELTLEFNEDVVLPVNSRISLNVTYIDGIYKSTPAKWSNLTVAYAKDKDGKNITNKLVVNLGNNPVVKKKYTVEVPEGIKDTYTNASDKFTITVVKPETDISTTPEAKITVDGSVDKSTINLNFSNTATGKGLTDAAIDLSNYKLGGSDLPSGTKIRFVDNRLKVQIILPEGSIVTNGSYVLSINNVKDEFGNTLKTGQENKVVELVENVAPKVASLSLPSSEVAQVTFTESVKFEDKNNDKSLSGVIVEVNGVIESGAKLTLSDDGKVLKVSGLSLKSSDTVTVKFLNAELFDLSANQNQLKDFIISK